MKEIASAVSTAVETYAQRMQRMSEEELSYKPSPEKWSKKEMIGHLIDSAQNNVQRFVRAQYEQTPRIVYAQDEWVKLQAYQSYVTSDLIQLWVLLNKHLCGILLAMDVHNYDKRCDTGKSSVDTHTLAWLAEDYLHHLNHHLKQID